MSDLKQTLFDKIATMHVYEVPNSQIAKTLGIDEGHVLRIKDDPEYLAQYRELSFERFNQMATLNDGWDNVEALAVSKVIDAMQANPDPDFALRAAAMANKAQRRGTKHNRPLEGGRQAHAVISLRGTFINKLEMHRPNEVIGVTMDAEEGPLPPEDAKLERKATNYMQPANIEGLLRPFLQVSDAGQDGQMASGETAVLHQEVPDQDHASAPGTTGHLTHSIDALFGN